MHKRIKLMFVLLALVIIFGTIIFAIKSTTIHAEVVTGAMMNNHDGIYCISTGIGAENDILCSPEQYVAYTGDKDFSRTDALFIVVYERKIFFPFQQKVISIKKYMDEWDDAIHSRIIPNKTYYRLVQEDFQCVDNKKGVLTRIYEKYESGNTQMILIADNFVTPYFENINSAKNWIRKSKKGLQLRPFTIVSDNVLSKWKCEAYNPTNEYSINSPQGLTYEELLRK